MATIKKPSSGEMLLLNEAGAVVAATREEQGGISKFRVWKELKALGVLGILTGREDGKNTRLSYRAAKAAISVWRELFLRADVTMSGEALWNLGCLIEAELEGTEEQKRDGGKDVPAPPKPAPKKKAPRKKAPRKKGPEEKLSPAAKKALEKLQGGGK